MAYSTKTEIEQIISALGVDLTSGDDFTVVAENASNITAAIEKVDSIIDFNLRKLYSAASITASTWVKWCSATLASCQLFRRRGNPCPESLNKECEQYIEDLKAIARGEMQLPDAAYQGNHFPSMTNVRIDMRYANRQIRRVPSTSTGNPSDPPIVDQNLQTGWGS
jgi:hypothetical protein